MAEDKNKPKIEPSYGRFTHSRGSKKPPVLAILSIVALLILLSIGGYYLGHHHGSSSESDKKDAAKEKMVHIDSLEDYGVHSLHHGDFYIIKEFVSKDSMLHIEFETKNELTLEFDLIDKEGYTVWKSPMMTEDPGHHEIQWKLEGRSGVHLPPGEYILAVDIDGERVEIGKLNHKL